MIFISAGHTLKGPKKDPGASGCAHTEAELTAIQRNLVMSELQRLGTEFITDKDDESLAEYLQRIKTGAGSVTAEVHFDSASPTASGCTAIIEEEADRLDKAFATELALATASILGITNRGVITEAQSHRGRLGLMREEGIICLLEIGFISNCSDVAKWEAKKELLATAIARLLIKYDDLIK